MWKNLLLQPALDNGCSNEFTGVKNLFTPIPQKGDFALLHKKRSRHPFGAGTYFLARSNIVPVK
jgi:hypothetical protein